MSGLFHSAFHMVPCCSQQSSKVTSLKSEAKELSTFHQRVEAASPLQGESGQQVKTKLQEAESC